MTCTIYKTNIIVNRNYNDVKNSIEEVNKNINDNQNKYDLKIELFKLTNESTSLQISSYNYFAIQVYGTCLNQQLNEKNIIRTSEEYMKNIGVFLLLHILGPGIGYFYAANNNVYINKEVAPYPLIWLEGYDSLGLLMILGQLLVPSFIRDGILMGICVLATTRLAFWYPGVDLILQHNSIVDTKYSFNEYIKNQTTYKIELLKW